MGCLLLFLIPLKPNTFFHMFSLYFLSLFFLVRPRFACRSPRLFGCSYGSFHIFLDVHYLFFYSLSLFPTSIRTSIPQYWSFFTSAFFCFFVFSWHFLAYFSWPNLVFGHSSGGFRSGSFIRWFHILISSNLL